MLPLLLLLAQQGPLPTVGDTVWITRSVSVASGVMVRPRPVAGTAVAEPLGPPEVIRLDREVRIRYPLVAWQPGSHAIVVPGPILVRSDGWSDTLPAGRAVIEVASILPDLPRDSLEPREALQPIERTRRSALPIALLMLLAILVLVPAHWWWGRRGPAAPAIRHPVRAGPTEAMLAAWLSAGESRAALEGWHHRLASLAAGNGLDAEGRAIFERLSGARFAPLDRDGVTALCDAAGRWLGARSA